jgi:dolichol kinase
MVYFSHISSEIAICSIMYGCIGFPIAKYIHLPARFQMMAAHNNPLCVNESLPLRKIVHMSGVAVPFVADIYGREYAALALAGATFIFLIMEAIKPAEKKWYVYGLLWRNREKEVFALDPFFYILSFFVLLGLSYFVNEGICYASMVVLALGDGVAPLIGHLRKLKLPGSCKTVEGTTGGIILSSIVGFYFVGALAVVGSVAGMVAECSISRHDNLFIPFAALMAMLLVRVFFKINV